MNIARNNDCAFSEYLYMGYSRSNKINYGYSPKDSRFESIFEQDLEK